MNSKASMGQGTQTPVITRIAPSPTGRLHIGTARTALFNYLFAKHTGGRFLLRIEDTDKARSTKEFEDNILEGLSALGLTWDELTRQSDHVGEHADALQRLVDTDKAYISREPAKDDPSQEVEVVRLRNPGHTITFSDSVRGGISFDTTELGDIVIARSMQDPLYHLAVVVDDAAARITHVIRGEDHISNTPRQILIQEALGITRPVYAHLPLILAPDRSKLSKRKGAVAVSEYLNEGYLPEALVNFLALMGWNPGTEQEVFTLDELVQAFTLEGVQKGGAIFDVERLKWMNREHRKRLSAGVLDEQLVARFATRAALHSALQRSSHARSDMLERYVTWKELEEAISAGEFSFYEERPRVTREALVWKKDQEPERLGARLRALKERIATIDATTFTYDSVKESVWDYAEAEGRGNVLWPLRYALSGKDRSPDPFVLMEALGKAETLARLDQALATVDTGT